MSDLSVLPFHSGSPSLLSTGAASLFDSALEAPTAPFDNAPSYAQRRRRLRVALLSKHHVRGGDQRVSE